MLTERERIYYGWLHRARFWASFLPDFMKKLMKRFWNPRIPETHMNFGESLIAKDRLKAIMDLMDQILSREVEGDLIECGVYKGGFTLAAAERLKLRGSKKRLHSIDTFEGHPFHSQEDVTADGTLHHPTGKYQEASYAKLKERIEGKRLTEMVELHQGTFERVFPKLGALRFSFALVDCDLYLSTKQCLDFLIPRMNPGGILFFDDYQAWTCPGATQAIDERFRSEELVKWPGWQAYWVKL